MQNGNGRKVEEEGGGDIRKIRNELNGNKAFGLYPILGLQAS